MKTTTVLPFFIWRTNGTTMKMPKLQSVKLYDVVGTLSPATALRTSKPTNKTTTISTTASSKTETDTLPPTTNDITLPYNNTLNNNTFFNNTNGTKNNSKKSK